jgi:chemotaxis protein CheX
MSDPVVLDQKLDLPAASALLVQLQDRKDQVLTLDFAQVKHLGALCLQVLLSAARSAVDDGRSIEIINVSDRVEEQLKVMGMTPQRIAKGAL